MQYKDGVSYQIIGLMSGTSLDGLDICYAAFIQSSGKWNYRIIHTQPVEYPEDLLQQLKDAVRLPGIELCLLDRNLGVFLGKAVNEFISGFRINRNEIDAIASHGHTVFHQPDKGLTVQIGCGASIAQETGIRTINDFRKKDVINGGQGAPLVPIGDQLLFSQYADAFLNIGGFANFSKMHPDDTITAFDICPANIIINHFSRQMGKEYDKNGETAARHPVDAPLFKALNSLEIYTEKQPKSLGWEWVEESVLPLFESSEMPVEAKIATATEHAAFQIAKRLDENGCNAVFVTGGGAKNEFLIQRVKHYFNGSIIIPDTETIDFKEALIFGFLGALHLENIPNCLPSVTGAAKAVVGGVLHQV